ncbi:whey acidic protein-like isoform X1 [Engystomops pustulosus]|uniref:whey acidic protein-like isoform X1 n=2 Tax=Engystomops pustulosus TaxID=76066 RepID=UPI003AFB7BFA
MEMKMSPIQVSFLGVFLCLVVRSITSACNERPGVCPPERFYNSSEKMESQCEDDSECPGDKKCCEDNGVKFCKPPAEGRNGTCPPCSYQEGITERRDDVCSADSDCAPGSLCCFTDSKKECTSTEEKEGFCGIAKFCFLPQRPLCKNDTGCPGKEKCCPSECIDMCLPPLKERPGQCPPVVSEESDEDESPKTDDYSTRIIIRCDSDANCTAPYKCCETMWGKNCTAPMGVEDLE